MTFDSVESRKKKLSVKKYKFGDDRRRLGKVESRLEEIIVLVDSSSQARWAPPSRLSGVAAAALVRGVGGSRRVNHVNWFLVKQIYVEKL